MAPWVDASRDTNGASAGDFSTCVGSSRGISVCGRVCHLPPLRGASVGNLGECLSRHQWGFGLRLLQALAELPRDLHLREGLPPASAPGCLVGSLGRCLRTPMGFRPAASPAARGAPEGASSAAEMPLASTPGCLVGNHASGDTMGLLPAASPTARGAPEGPPSAAGSATCVHSDVPLSATWRSAHSRSPTAAEPTVEPQRTRFPTSLRLVPDGIPEGSPTRSRHCEMRPLLPCSSTSGPSRRQR